jgi:triacylglycerol esterase/lipase EstA (alpha/beta hydrolase family)
MEMGERLATEVKQYIISFCPSSCLSKISFVGHSLGGVIVRASLPHLSEYSSKFFTFISLASPHLGQLHNSSKLVELGTWVIKKWRKSKSLQ